MADDIHRGAARAGFVFTGLFLVAFLLIGADTPDYAAPDREWVAWAEDTGSANEIAMVAILLAGIAFLILGAAIRARFAADDAHSKIVEHGYVTGGILGIAGIVMAILLIGAASFEGAGTDAAVSRAVNLAATGRSYSPQWDSLPSWQPWVCRRGAPASTRCGRHTSPWPGRCCSR